MNDTVTVRLSEGMLRALKEQAEADFTSVSTIARQACSAYLKSRGVDWRQYEGGSQRAEEQS